MKFLQSIITSSYYYSREEHGFTLMA